MKYLFLGGTCNNSTWRDVVISHIKEYNLSLTYFNPVVADWTPECQAEEIRQRETCDICLYVITQKMTGVFAIAEVVEDSNKRPDKTIFCYLPTDDGTEFTPHQIKSLDMTGKLVSANGVPVFNNMTDLLQHLLITSYN